jgi:putative membrane protein
MHWFNGWHMAGMWFWWIPIIVLVVAAIWLIIYLSRRDRGRPADSPEVTLKNRYARGDIDRDTYERMLSELRK